MASAIARAKGNSATIAGDACLFTAATFCLLAVAGGPLALIIGPAAAWLLHGRRLDRPAAVSGGFGLVAGVVAVGGFFVVLPLLARAVEPPGWSEFAIPVALLAVAGAVFLAVVVGLDVDGIRDLSPSRRHHVRLDIARLVSTLVVVVFAAVVTLVQLANPAGEIGEAGIFALGAAAVGAVTMLVADAIHARREKQSGQ